MDQDAASSRRVPKSCNTSREGRLGPPPDFCVLFSRLRVVLHELELELVTYNKKEIYLANWYKKHARTGIRPDCLTNRAGKQIEEKSRNSP